MDHRGQMGVMERLGKGSRHVLGPKTSTERDVASRRGARTYGISMGSVT